MDAAFWLPGWRQPSAQEWAARVGELVATEAWVIDGSHGDSLEAVLARAELAVFLDVGRVRAVLRLVRRRLRGTRPDLPLPARLPLAFVWETWWYPDRLRPGLVAQLEVSGVPWVRLRTPAEVERWLAG